MDKRPFSLLLLLLLAACTAPAPATESGTMRLTSAAFADGGAIPERYACTRQGGDNLSPPLAWAGVPPDAASLALIVHDPHPTARDWLHWVLLDVDPAVSGLPEGVPAGAAVPDGVIPGGAAQRENSSRVAGYVGPCPPDPPHAYVFTLYALRAAPDVADGAAYDEILGALDGLVMASTTLTGVYGSP